jgi:hypothetical protein
MASGLYQLWKQELSKGTANTALSGAGLKAALVSAVYTPNFATDQFWSSVSANVVGTPVVLASKTYDLGVLDAADTVFTAVLSGTATKIVIYYDTTVTTTSPLVCSIDISSVTGNGGDITAVWNASGILAL